MQTVRRERKVKRGDGVTHSVFGRTADGGTVTAWCLRNHQGAQAVILDYGCTVQSLVVPDARGGFTDVVLGYDTVHEYEDNGGYIGCAVGRFANRIGKGAFTLNEKTYLLARNDGENHLHGGLRGFDKYIWDSEVQGNSLALTRLSPDGEENYPGNLSVRITYTLTDDNALRLAYDADTDADTIVNLTNHSYFNLNGQGSVLQHFLQVFADAYTGIDKNCLPTGAFQPTAGSAFDFRELKQIGRDIDAPDIQLHYGSGYDHNFVLSGSFMLISPVKSRKAAVLYSPESGIRMTVLTTQPGMQVYSGNHLTNRKGKNGIKFGRRSAVCLETQCFPDAMSHANFPSPVLRPDMHYHEETVYRFDIPGGRA
jgi:aldose 1-epimerase